MQWIDFAGEAPFVAFHAAAVDGRLSDQLACDEDIDKAAENLRREIELATRQMKAALQKRWEPSPRD